VPCHLPYVDGIIDPSLVMVLGGLKCMCFPKNVATMLVCG